MENALRPSSILTRMPCALRINRCLGISFAFAAIFAAARARAADEKHPSPTTDPSRRIAVGVYFNEAKIYAPADPQAFKDLEAQTGRLARVYMNFQLWVEPWSRFSTRLADNAIKNGGVYMVVWMPSGHNVDARSDPDWTCAAVASGKHDDYIRPYATDVARWGAADHKPLMIRFAHEMNGGWYLYGVAFNKDGQRHNGNTPADYVAMWRHVWQIFHDAGATNVQWVWSPNILYINAANTREQAVADLAALYPGDAFVDWIGLDGYNNGIKSKWKSFADLYRPSYDAITKLSARPLMVAECGCTEEGAPPGQSKAAWITQAYLTDIPQQFPRIMLVNWFDRDKSKLGEADWRFNSSPAALEAYRAAVNAPLYQGDLPTKR